MSPRRRGAAGDGASDLFSSAPTPSLSPSLAALPWPEQSRFPVNHTGARVRALVWADLTASTNPLVVTGFASIDKVIELVAALAERRTHPRLRLLLGTEPFSSERVSYGSPSTLFEEDVRRYWIEDQGVSLLLCAKIVTAIQALDEGWFEVRFLPGSTRLHAKIYVGDDAVTLGSSNFTHHGLHHQYEANVRFHRTDGSGGERPDERVRYDETRQVAENYWSIGTTWSERLRHLLHDMLRFVTWQEALARASTDLLDGQWAERHIASDPASSALWPSQRTGIAQAMWVIENVGGALIADATGSGKTRTGAHIARAVKERLRRTGRAHRDGLTVVVCPPPVEPSWQREALECDLTLRIVSHGLLSRAGPDGTRPEAQEVARAQILAVDEAHNFLSTTSQRTTRLRDSRAEHVLLFTATPINSGVTDLLALVDLLGADNFDDDTLTVLEQLHHRRGQHYLSETETALLRREIQRFTVRRTKTMLNALVDREPHAYRHPSTGRVCRYPEHRTREYATGESAADIDIATETRALTKDLAGVCQLGQTLVVPLGLHQLYSAERWLTLRLASARGLAAHHVLSAMRSSRAALLEHLIGTAGAVEALGLPAPPKAKGTGNMVASAVSAGERRPPHVPPGVVAPSWLTDPARWQERCHADAAIYAQIARLAERLSDARETAKAQRVLTVARSAGRVIAFDRHPITLTAVAAVLSRLQADDAGPDLDLDPIRDRDRDRGEEIPVIVATGSTGQARREVVRRFSPAAPKERGIALCTEALNEGLNLQGAAALVHLDMPTTLRVAEQRVGRVDRMDSPHDSIQVWWPRDGEAFATRADEQLHERNLHSASLLGSNLPLPEASRGDVAKVTAQTFQDEELVTTWDGIVDALDPVRGLVSGPDAVLTAEQYEQHRLSTTRVLARVSPVRSSVPWVFFAVSGSRDGAPRWMLVEDGGQAKVDLMEITERLRQLLREDPASAGFDATAETLLGRFVRQARQAEHELLPRRHQRALTQMRLCCRAWAKASRSAGDHESADRWDALARLTDTEDTGERVPDQYAVAEAWWALTRDVREEHRRQPRTRRFTTLSDIDGQLRTTPLSLEAVEVAVAEVRLNEPFEQRVSACILGVPES